MNVFVGSKNQNKVDAVTDSIKDYDLFDGAKVTEKDVASDVSDQPKSLDEIVTGAKNRAKNAYETESISFGLEDGLMAVPESKSGYMNVCVCSIYDGTTYHLGLSSAFENPKEVMDLMMNDGLEMSQAYFKAGFTDNANLGKLGGSIGLLTKKRLLRKEYTQQAVQTALIHLENVL